VPLGFIFLKMNPTVYQMADTIKKFRITGEAAKSLASESEPTKTRRRGRQQRGGQAPVQVSRSDAPSFTPLPPAAASLPAPITATSPVATAPPQEQHGGRKDVKVILDKTNHKTRKLILAPKKVIKLPPGPLARGTGEAVKKHSHAKTQKVARRIRVSVSGRNKRVNRAKTIKKESQVMPIEKLKKELETAGLIKAGSKAPETILRQMYTDFQVLKQRAL
jgi:hypothetical protein